MTGRTLTTTSAAVVATAVVGGLATDVDSDWYRGLELPAWQPPPQTFGLVWTPLYAGIAALSARSLDRLAAEGDSAGRRAYQRSLATNLVLNAGWSWLFFRAHRPWVAVAGAAALTVSSADLARRTTAADPRAGRLLWAYPAWTAFATVLSTAIARRN